MADTKITALLTPQVTTNPATDVLPIVNIADTLMASSGSTRKITVNSLLGAGGTATLASATITGDLTVDTSTLKVDSSNDRVGIGTATPAAKLIVRDGSNRNLLVSSDASQLGSAGVAIGSFTDNAAGYAPLSIIAGTSIGFGINGSTAMTLNSTGLGVGVASPSYKLDIAGTGNFQQLRVSNSSATNIGLVNTTSGLTYTLYSANTASNGFNGFGIFNGTDYDLRIVSGNVGIGVTPTVRLHVSTTALIAARLESTSASNSSLIDFKDPSTTATAKVMVGSNGDALRLFSGGNLSATLDASGNLILLSSNTPATLTTNGQLTVNATSNTNLRFSYRGSDGTTRVANITLA